jgi:hypothetical protein
LFKNDAIKCRWPLFSRKAELVVIAFVVAPAPRRLSRVAAGLSRFL